MTTPLVIAHRGASGHEPENSLAAFRAASALGADAIELDIRVTVDGALLVHHDATIGGRTVADLHYKDLRDARLANDEPVPTLSEALEVIDPRLEVFVEAKELPQRYDQNLFRALEAGPSPSNYHIHSFDHRVVHRLHQGNSTFGYGVLAVAYPIRPLMALDDANATALWQEHSLIDGDLVEAVHQAHGRVYAWTTNTANEITRVCQLGVDGVTTNYPDMARRLVDA